MIEVARSRTGATTDVRLPGVQVAKKEPVYGCLGVHCDGTAAGVAKARNMDHKTKYTRRQEAQFDHGTIWQMRCDRVQMLDTVQGFHHCDSIGGHGSVAPGIL